MKLVKTEINHPVVTGIQVFQTLDHGKNIDGRLGCKSWDRLAADMMDCDQGELFEPLGRLLHDDDISHQPHVNTLEVDVTVAVAA